MTGTSEREIFAADAVVVHRVGDVNDDDRVYGQGKVAHAARSAPRPVRYAKLDLRVEPDPARALPAIVTAELDVDGRVVRARAEAPTVHEAIDLADARLRQNLERLAHHVTSERRRHRDDASWHHGDAHEQRPAFFPRPVGEREIVRRKTHAIPATTPDEARLDLELLGHDFFLFREARTGTDCVIARGPDGYVLLTEEGVAGIETPPPIELSAVHAEPFAVDEAVERLDASGEPFVFFLDADSRRGRVLYRRYDGHYGLIEPADT